MVLILSFATQEQGYVVVLNFSFRRNNFFDNTPPEIEKKRYRLEPVETPKKIKVVVCNMQFKFKYKN